MVTAQRVLTYVVYRTALGAHALTSVAWCLVTARAVQTPAVYQTATGLLVTLATRITGSLTADSMVVVYPTVFAHAMMDTPEAVVM